MSYGNKNNNNDNRKEKIFVFYAVTQLLEKWDNFSRTDSFLFFLLSTLVPYNFNRLDVNIENGGL